MSADNDRPTWVQHTITEQPWANQRQVVITLSLMVVVGVIIAALYLLQITVTTTTAISQNHLARDTTASIPSDG